jgi:heat shock protein HslJ
VRLVFREEAPPDPAPLIGTTWSLESIALGTDAVASLVACTDASLELGDDGSASGSGGSNTFSTAYETEGASVSFDAVVSARMACEAEVMTQEAAVFGTLESAASFDIEGDVLTLNDGDGEFLVSFRAVE